MTPSLVDLALLSRADEQTEDVKQITRESSWRRCEWEKCGTRIAYWNKSGLCGRHLDTSTQRKSRSKRPDHIPALRGCSRAGCEGTITWRNQSGICRDCYNSYTSRAERRGE